MTSKTKPQPDPSDVLYVCSLEDLNCLHDYLVAAINGNDISELPRLWNQQIGVIRSRTSPKFSSTDLLLLAHDEWKRREERRRLHDVIPWVAGFINGFLTDKKWARDHLDKMQQEAQR